MTQYLMPSPQLPTPSVITAPRDTVTRAETDVALGELQRQIGDATQRTDVLLQAVVETHQKAEQARQIAVSGATGVAQTNAGLAKMVEELRHELHQMRTKIEGAEEHANTAQRITDSAEQRAVAAQSDADAAKAKQEQLEHELQNADLAFQQERKIRTTEIAAAQHTIGALQNELHDARTRLDAQGVIVQDVAGIGGELREARKDMALKAAEMREMGDMTDEMLGHVENLTTAFHQIDAKQKRGNVVNPNVVKSTPVHVQGTTSDLKEPAGHVQTEPKSVINLVSGESEEQRQPVAGRSYSENWVDIDEPNPQVMTSSQMAEQSGEKAAPTFLVFQARSFHHMIRGMLWMMTRIDFHRHRRQKDHGWLWIVLHDCLVVLSAQLKTSSERTWSSWVSMSDPNRLMKACGKVRLGIIQIPVQKTHNFRSLSSRKVQHQQHPVNRSLPPPSGDRRSLRHSQGMPMMMSIYGHH